MVHTCDLTGQGHSMASKDFSSPLSFEREMALDCSGIQVILSYEKEARIQQGIDA